MDLGSSASTEWDSDALAKIVKKKAKKHKLCFMGLLHSHHNMGAYFSQTDEDTLIEMAPDTGFYPSLVVSTKADKNFAFAISYLDQYKKGSIINGKIDINREKGNKEWIEIGDKIEKEAKTTILAPTNRYSKYGYTGYQSEIWDEPYDEDTLRKGKDIWSKFKNPQNDMDYNEMMKEMSNLKIVQPYTVFGGTGWNY
mgnify:CR=1 FL=1